MSASQERFEDLCVQVCREERWERLPNGIRITWRGGRHQLVAREFFEHDEQESVRLYARIGLVDRLDEERLVMALRVNAGLPTGALAVRQDYLVLVATQRLESLDLNQLRVSIDDLARTADSYEKSLFGTDSY